MEDAQRQVVMRAIAYAAEQGLPGDHHFYVTFRTDFPGVQVPARISAQYPEEMTVVLQHQFWDLTVDEAVTQFSVGLSFGGVPSQLSIPFDAISAFADPEVQYGLRFSPVSTAAEEEPAPAPGPVAALPAPAAPPPAPAAGDADPPEDAQVVSLDAFRRRPKE